jgi:hypothetical protein
MGDSEAEVAQVIFKLTESEDFTNHSPVIGDFDMLE